VGARAINAFVCALESALSGQESPVKRATMFSASCVALALYATDSARSRKAEESNATGPRRPILFELFTSEGCSSCPPADRLLETLDHTQPVVGAQLIVLSEHVDYWNRLGWAEPFSSALFTQRQQDYVNRFRLGSAYTPQLLVDGQKDVVGSDERAARAAILKARRVLLSHLCQDQGQRIFGSSESFPALPFTDLPKPLCQIEVGLGSLTLT
jgi:hypothetical protein